LENSQQSKLFFANCAHRTRSASLKKLSKIEKRGESKVDFASA